MISLNLTNRTNISLNTYIINSINIFKSTPKELYKYVMDQCAENPLIYIKDNQHFPGAASLSASHQADLIQNIKTHFRCTLSKSDSSVMDIIIASLSSKGFLETSNEDIAAMTNVSSEKVNDLIDRLKYYESMGIGTSGALDYIKFQLTIKGAYHADYFEAFKNHMHEISAGDYRFLSGSDIEPDDFKEYVETHIKSCALYPLDGEDSVDVIPEGFIRFQNDQLQIHIEDYLAEDIIFEPIALTEGRTGFTDKMKEYHDAFNELVSMLRARKLYILKIMNVICEVQKDYLSGKTDYLNPLDQTMLAEMTELSAATVSRLISDKYISTPRGLLPIQSLLSKECCKGYSVSQVKFIIRNINDYETLSDNKISILLNDLGVKISRRTVNKYKNQILANH